MARSADDRENRLAILRQEVTKRGAERHASVMRDISELPPELQSTALKTLLSSDSVQTIIGFPPQIQHGWSYVPRQALLFSTQGVVHLLASIWPDQEPRVTFLEGRGLIYSRISLLLLYGFVEIVAKGSDAPTRLGIEFNTMAWYSLSAPLRQLITMPLAVSSTRRVIFGHSPAELPDLERLPPKFSNGAKIYGLLPGEELEAMVFQPKLWRRWMYPFRRPILANTLLLLTTHYVAVIQEEKDVSYGWIISHIPRDCIAEVQNRTLPTCNELIFQLEREGQTAEFGLPLKEEIAEAWRMRWVEHGGQWQDLSEHI